MICMIAIRKSRRLLFPFAAIRMSHQLLRIRSSHLPLADTDTRVLSAYHLLRTAIGTVNFFAIGSSRLYQSGISVARVAVCSVRSLDALVLHHRVLRNLRKIQDPRVYV